MVIEKIITSIARKKNSEYLRFVPVDKMPVPYRDSPTPTLLYIHIPFCEELCPYCSFNRVVFKEDLARRYFDALRKEINIYKDLNYNFEALYAGGGTPTILIDELSETLDLARQLFHLKEISVETNPNHLTPFNIKKLRDMGINRLSVGVQSFDDGLLRLIERYHKYGSGREIKERLKYTQGNFDTVNVDMIFNFPTQTMEILESDLSTLIDLNIDQITYYPLMVSKSTRAAMIKKLGDVDYERGNRMYLKILEMLSERYTASTAWCFSRNRALIDEYVVNFDEYAGAGSGSIGYLNGCAYANTFDINLYISQINKGILPVMAKREFTLKEQISYDFLMKLFGLSLDLEKLSKKNKVNVFRYLFAEILFFIMTGALKKEGKTLRLTKKGQYYWVIMMREFFIGVNNFRDYCRSMLNM
ncbi:MAG TPA: coproporphyrinogen III oxidase family protein [Syntrophorhabdaceae bacterium]|nr:coproporphyrinogen III oxidase family protein [Syntrophorhabdaceae bacterium]HOL06516.1 coproporphyrinogen III oxidase family protein [Syntrophorhabdaceae bacterium]HON86008.1 coproporphyrinogen III oxidase family protein [Syntrophorhabdaceae bacterium]HOT41861.1 coproporphyrinogen III oxidase family protein [Syntrophorhabdaceae bacterium]HPC67366.1 coproporphyrinogen III oxidase family protein [Syntrophorhabdaceae bacterium]